MEFHLRNAHERDMASFDFFRPVVADVPSVSSDVRMQSPSMPRMTVRASESAKSATKAVRAKSQRTIDLNFAPEPSGSVDESVSASSPSSDEAALRATEQVLAQRFDPDGRGPVLLQRRAWPETSEDEASTEDHTSEIWRRRDEESSDDGGALHLTTTQYVASLSPLEGEKKFDVGGCLKAEFAIPQKASVWRERGVVDPNFVVCDPPQEVRVFWKSSTVLEIVPVGKWQGSTSYVVHVSAAVVGKLEDSSGFTFRFHTECLRVDMYARSSREDPLRPVFKLVPNQKVDEAKLMAGLALTSRPKGVTGFLMSSVSRFQRSSHAFSLQREGQDFLFVVPIGPLPPNSVVELLLSPGSYSLEGPNPSEEAFSIEFSTYPPLTIVSRHPSYFHKITPGETLRFNFSNDLRGGTPELLQNLVEISPSVPFLVAVSPESRLNITPETDAFCSYTVRISGAIADVYGQQLNVPEVFSFTTGQWPPFDGTLKSASSALLLSHAGGAAPKVYQYSSFNVSQVRERCFVLSGDALPLFASENDAASEDVVDWIKKNGKCVIDRPRALSRLLPSEWNVFDWSSALSSDLGRVGVLVELGDALSARLQAQGQNPNRFALAAIVQCTTMAISAVAQMGTCVIAVSRLADGSPVAGALLREADGGGKLGVTNHDGVVAVSSRLPDKRILAIAPDNPQDVCFFVLPKPTIVEISHALCSVLLDRSVFSPLDTVHCKLWARACAPPFGETLIKFEAGSLLIWRCARMYSKDHLVEVASGTATFSALSSALFAFELPADATPGRHLLQFYATVPCWNEEDALIGQYELMVDKALVVAAAPPPMSCEVSVTTIRAGSNVAVALAEDGSAIATVTTFGSRGGAKLRGAQVKWTAVVKDSPWVVPSDLLAEAFVFGLTDLRSKPEPFEFSPSALITELGSSGASRLALTWSGVDAWSRPLEVSVKAVVQDLFQNVASAESSLTIAPSAHPLVGIKQSRSWVLGDRTVKVECVTASFGKLAPGAHVSIGLALCDASGEFVMEQTFSLVTDSVSARGAVEFSPKSFGHYRIEARCGASPTMTTSSVFVAPPASEVIPALAATASMARVSICLHPRRHVYEIGQPVEVLVLCSVGGAFGLAVLLSHATGAVLMEQSLRFDERGSAAFKLTMERRWQSGFKLCVLAAGHGKDLPWWAETELLVNLSDISKQLELDCQPVWTGSKCVLSCVAKLNGAVVEGVELVVVSRNSALGNFSLGVPLAHRQSIATDSRLTLLPTLPDVAMAASAQSTSSVEEGSRSFVDLPEEDLKDDRQHYEVSSLIEDHTTTSSDETARGFLAFLCVEYGGKPFAWVGDAKFEPLALKVVRGIVEPGKRVIRDEAGAFQFVVHRSALNCVAACVISKQAPPAVGYKVLDDVLSRVAMGAPWSLNDVFSGWSAGPKKAGSGSPQRISGSKALMAPPSKAALWETVEHFGVSVVGLDDGQPGGVEKDKLFCVCPNPTAADGTARVELPEMVDATSLHVLAVLLKENVFGLQRVTVTRERQTHVAVVAPEVVRVGDEFEVVGRITAGDELLKTGGQVTVVFDTSIPDHLMLAPNHSNRFVLTVQSSVNEYVVATRFVVVSGGLSAKNECCGTISVALSDARRSVSSHNVSVLWPVIEGPNGLQSQLSMTGSLESSPESLTFGLSFLNEADRCGSEGGLEVKLSRSAMIYLVPAIEHLMKTGSDMVEVLSSRILGLCACFPRLDHMDLNPAIISSRIRQDVGLLLELQGALGGFGQWNRNTAAASSFLSAHAAHALWEASLLFPGFISNAALDRCRSFVDAASRVPVLNKRDVRARAYATFVGVKMGACLVSAAQAQRVAMEEDHGEMDTLGWLLSSVCLSSALLRKQEESKKKAGGGRFSFFGLFGASDAAATKERDSAMDTLVARLFEVFDRSQQPQSDHDCFASETRGRCVALESALLMLGELAGKGASVSRLQKRLPELAINILAGRVSSGSWMSSHEACFACVALGRHLSLLPLSPGDGTMADTLLFGGEVLPFVARSVRLSWKELVSSGLSEVTLHGAAGSHFLVSVERRIASPQTCPPSWRGLRVWRRIESVDEPDDVKVEGQCVRMRAGRRARIVVGLAPVTDEPGTQQLVLRAALCPGLIVLGPRLLQAEWSDHVALESDCVMLAAEKLAGRTERVFSVVVRAVHRGAFVWPPAIAWERYHPSVCGRTSGMSFIVE